VRDTGIGKLTPPALATLCTDERLCLGVLKMVDASFKAYDGPGYMHYSGGGGLLPNDFSGLSTLLSRRDHGLHVNPTHVRAGLNFLRRRNPHVKRMLSCFEREVQYPRTDDRFPTRAGGTSAMPSTLDAARPLGCNDDAE
jgi:hypothetical protein